MDTIIRPAVAADADALAVAHVEAWRTGYRTMMPDQYLDGLRAADRIDGWRAHLTAPDPLRPVLVAAIGVGSDDVVGFVQFGPDRDSPAPTDGSCGLGELYAVNLAPRAWGHGVGRALVRAAAEGLRALGHDEAVLWVVPANTRARTLYESEGWRADGESREFELYGITVPEVRYRRAL